METENIQNKNVETYADDMAEVIEDSGGSLIKKVIHDQEDKEAEQKSMDPESMRNKAFMVFSILLLVVALGALAYLFAVRETINTVSLQEQFTPLIFVDKTDFVEVGGLDKEKLSGSVYLKVQASDVKNGAVEAIYLTENKKIIGFNRLNALLGSNIPATLAPFVNDNFLMGALTKDGSKDLFVFLKVNSFTDIFPGVHSWEDKMLFDLHGFFGIQVSADTNYLFTKDFEDGIVENKNARILYDTDRNIVLMYVFADDKTIIITNTLAAAEEAMIRMAGSRVKK